MKKKNNHKHMPHTLLHWLSLTHWNLIIYMDQLDEKPSPEQILIYRQLKLLEQTSVKYE